MLADRQLEQLANRKALLQARITVRRMECMLAGVQLARPLAFVDRITEGWKRLSPLVKYVGVPLGFMAARKFTKASDGGTSKGKLATLLGVLPVVYEAWKGFREHRRAPTPPPSTAPSG